MRAGIIPIFQIRRGPARLLFFFDWPFPRLIGLLGVLPIGLLAQIVVWFLFAHRRGLSVVCSDSGFSAPPCGTALLHVRSPLRFQQQQSAETPLVPRSWRIGTNLGRPFDAMPGLRDMRDLGRGWRMSTVPRSRSAKATHRRAVARCQKRADSGSHRRSGSLRLLCHPGEFHSGSTAGTGCVKFFFDSHWPARRVRLDGMEHQALLNVAQGKGVKIAMEGPINPPPVAGGAGRELPAYLSNGVVGLKVRDNPLQNPLHRGSSSKSKLWSAVDMTEPVGRSS
jgi:hypothetical protein